MNISINELNNKILNKQELTEKELESLSYLCNPVIKIEHDNNRWDRLVEIIFKINDRFFNLSYFEGLTENQEDYFSMQPFEVEREEKVVSTIQVTYKKKEQK